MRPTIRVLGALEAEVGGSRADLGGPLQRAVLALLLTERGSVVSIDRMIDRLWHGQPPPRAIASLQAYVSNLRRVLEPGRGQRAPATLLVSKAPGYALLLPAGAVDAWRFELLLAAAREAAERDPGLARRHLDDALALWRGPAYAEFADEEWAAAEVARLDELHLAAQESSVKILLRTGDTAQAVAAADALTRRQPLREESWRLLALALWAGERQADALAALRRARGVLREELGLDPGPALAGLEGAILGQRLDVLRHALASPVPAVPAVPAAPAAPARQAEASALPGAAARAGQAAAGGAAEEEPFVGRAAEMARLVAVAARRTGGVVLVTGEPGAGKSSLLHRASGELTAAGWTVVTGHCPGAEGAPPAWAWTEALRELARHAPPAEHATALDPLLGPAAKPPPSRRVGCPVHAAPGGDRVAEGLCRGPAPRPGLRRPAQRGHRNAPAAGGRRRRADRVRGPGDGRLPYR